MNLPDHITEIQYQEMKKLFEYLKDFSVLLIQGGMKSDGVMVTEATYAKELEKENINIENIDEYLQQLKTEEKHL